jgi:glycosyltransferase involved in cell wall biosynthesis
LKVNKPLVSVITPSWNSASYIEQTILSVINQTYRNVEYIIIDGGSSDGTLDIIRKYESSIDYWVSETDDGMYQAINKGMRRASGEIVAYLNSDDLYYPDTLEKVVNFFADNSSAELVYGNLDFVNEEGNKLFTQIYPRFNLNFFIRANCSMIGQPAAFWRSSLLKKIGMFDESLKMAADFEFFIRAGMIGKPMYTPDVLAAFRTHKLSLTSTQSQRGQDEVRLIHKNYLANRSPILAAIVKNLFSIYFKVINYNAMRVKLVIVLRRLLNV